MYEIISKRASFLERSITFSVDGNVETISAPASNVTFDDLILSIEQRYGDSSKVEKASDGPTDQQETKNSKRSRKSTSNKAE